MVVEVAGNGGISGTPTGVGVGLSHSPWGGKNIYPKTTYVVSAGLCTSSWNRASFTVYVPVSCFWGKISGSFQTS